MEKMYKKTTLPIKQAFKEEHTVTSVIEKKSNPQNLAIEASIIRGKLLNYAHYIPEVKKHLKNLKNANPKYLNLIDKMINISIQELPTIDINLRGMILEKLLEDTINASFHNQEVLDFTQEIFNTADTLTIKYYLAHISTGLITNTQLKQHFKATIPFIKYLYNAINNDKTLGKQTDFINTINIIVNPKADAEKIKLLPKIKYIVDKYSKNNHPINVPSLIYGFTPIEHIENKIPSLGKAIQTYEKLGKTLDCINYLIQN